MKLYAGKIPAIAQDIVKTLTSTEAMDTDAPAEVVKDVESVLKEYLRAEREIVEEAKTRMERKGLTYSMLSKVRSQLSEERGFPPPEEFLPYILDQILEMLLNHSANVDEVYATDMELRKAITPILKKHLEVEAELDREIRARLKHLDEGTAAFEIEYQKLVDQMRRKKHLA